MSTITFLAEKERHLPLYLLAFLPTATSIWKEQTLMLSIKDYLSITHNMAFLSKINSDLLSNSYFNECGIEEGLDYL